MEKKRLKRRFQKKLDNYGTGKIHTSVYLTNQLHNFIKLQCGIHGTSMNKYICELIYERIPKWKK